MIADHYLQLRTRARNCTRGLAQTEPGNAPRSATLDTLHGLLTDIREPLLFVVVGEVKAGKSSLLNALFGQEFAKVDVLPATDRVYIFRYGEEEKSVEVSPQLTERYQPIDFLRDFNVVDTPGTNTMVRGAPDDHRKFRPARRSRALCFFGDQSVDAVRLGAARISCKRNG